jgi:hypothetical protein
VVTDRVRRTPSRQTLEGALLKVAEDWRLFWINAADYKGLAVIADYKGLAVIEGCAHELAHALDLGRTFEDLLQTMPDEESNKHEASVLRIEVAALAALGVRLSMRRLRAFANWDGSVGIPSHAQLHALRNFARAGSGKRFVALITHEIRSLASPNTYGGKHE